MNRPNRLAARVITVLNLKGGVGKTHTTWLLAGVCEERRHSCLCLDLDTQVSEAIRYLQLRENSRLQLLGYLISRFKAARSYQHSYSAKLRDVFEDLAFDAIVPYLARFEKNVTHKVPVTFRAPRSGEAHIARQLPGAPHGAFSPAWGLSMVLYCLPRMGPNCAYLQRNGHPNRGELRPP